MSNKHDVALDALVNSQEAAAELREQDVRPFRRPGQPVRSRPRPEELSRQLREDTTDDLVRRRWLVGLSLGAAFLGKIIALYQVGIIRRLPDLPIAPFDASRVDASAAAYRIAQIPDGFLMAGSYLTTALLAAAGGKDRRSSDPALPVALLAKTVADAALGLVYTRIGWREQRALCGYCQTSTLLSLASVALAWPEAAKAMRRR